MSTSDTFFATPDFMPTGSRSDQEFKTSRITAFGWYGGKYYHLDFLRPLFPLDAVTFCDVFGGSGVVVLNVGNYLAKIYNDIDPEVVNFFQVLKNSETRETLIREITLTPYAREEFNNAQTKIGGSEIERAVRFYIRARQARNSVAQVITHATWSYGKNFSKGPNKWSVAEHNLRKVARCLQHIYIEHTTALEILKKYDTPETVFYLDPPYVASTRNDSATQVYKYEMTDQDHIHLSEVLRTLQGRAVLSGYRSDFYDRLYKDWNRIDAQSREIKSGGSGSWRQESVWKNF